MREITIDITKVDLDLNTNGSEPKFWYNLGEYNFLFKFQKKDWYNIYSEHFASKFINMTGGCSHETEIVKVSANIDFNVNKEIVFLVPVTRNEGKLAVICKDITKDHGEMVVFHEKIESKDTTSNDFNYYFSDIIRDLKKYHNIDFNTIESSFWEMYIYDSILGNTDRHSGNWGIVVDKNRNRKLSPIFDNGASLLPRAKFYIGDREWFRERIFKFPNSKIMMDNKKERSNYYEVLRSGIISESFLNRFKDWDILTIIKEWLDEDTLTVEQKLFYSIYVYLRYKVIIENSDFDNEYDYIISKLDSMKLFFSNKINLIW